MGGIVAYQQKDLTVYYRLTKRRQLLHLLFKKRDKRLACMEMNGVHLNFHGCGG